MKRLLIMLVLALPSVANADKLHYDLCVAKARKTYQVCVDDCSDKYGITTPKGTRCLSDCGTDLNENESACNQYR